MKTKIGKIRKLKFAPLSEENILLRKMTNWQNSQWLRAGGYIPGLAGRVKNLERINHFLNLKKQGVLELDHANT